MGGDKFRQPSLGTIVRSVGHTAPADTRRSRIMYAFSPTSIFEGPYRPDLVRSVLSHYCAFERVLSLRNSQYSALKELSKGPGEYTRLCPFFKATYPTVSGPSDPKPSIWRYSGNKDWSRRLSPGFTNAATSIGFFVGPI